MFDFEKVILYVTPIITLIGWLATYLIQKTILKENRNNQKLDRELTIFRERLSIINGIISENIETTFQYTKLYYLLKSRNFDFEEGGQILAELQPHSKQLINLLFDPSFRSMQNCLPKDVSDKIYESIRETNSLIGDFHAEALKIDENTPNLNSKLDSLSEKIINIPPKIIQLSELLSQEYSKLERKLSE